MRSSVTHRETIRQRRRSTIKPFSERATLALLETIRAPEMCERDTQAPQAFHLISRRPLGDRKVGTGRHTLILDRDPLIRERLGTYLWRRGYTVWPAANAVEPSRS
jgi:hypothetical protein